MAPILCVVIALQSLAGPVSPDARSPRVEREAWVMGTRLRVVTEAPELPAARDASEAVVREVERLEDLLSTWDPTTPVSRLNQAAPGGAVALPGELGALLEEARAWGRSTGGAFDPAVGALVDAWDLRGQGRVPDAEAASRARRASGPGVWELRGDSAVRLDPAAWIDTGGFGKGAALRSAAELLRRSGVSRALVDLGGQLWAQAPPARPWSVPVAHPLHRHRPAALLRLHGVSAATSGTSERWVEVDGERLGHILDPRTGRPAPSWGTVTVVHPDPFVADVLSTALHVMGPEDGMAWLADRPSVAALFLEARGGELIPRWSPAMKRWLAEPPLRPGAGATEASVRGR